MHMKYHVYGVIASAINRVTSVPNSRTVQGRTLYIVRSTPHNIAFFEKPTRRWWLNLPYVSGVEAFAMWFTQRM
jgi:hypothetical protein